MLEVDLHCHTLFSKCGIHTHMELLTRAKEIGLKGLAITDHGPILKPTTPGPFWDRLNSPLEGIKMFKGMECNVLDEDGNIDLLDEKLKYMDIVLLGLHPNLPPCDDKHKNTNMLIKAMEKNNAVNVITHPNDNHYPVNFYRLAASAIENNVVIELNNSKTLLQRVDDSVTKELISACKELGCPMIVNSDAHAIEELGLDESVRPLLDELDFPEDLIVNSTAEKAFEYLESIKR